MQTRFFDANRSHRLRHMLSAAQPVHAVIRKTGDELDIELSDGRHTRLPIVRHVAFENTLAAAEQWTRRHGASTVALDLG
jgi:hypothetical protein